MTTSHLDRSFRRQPAAGFSLLELMTVVAVLGIFVAIAFPSMQYLSHITQVKAASTNLYMGLLKARSEAVKRNAAVTLTPASGGNWQTGWNLCFATSTCSATDPNLIASQGELKGVVVNSNITTNLVYLSSGRLQGGVTPTFSVIHSTKATDPTTSVARCVSVAPNGSPYVKSTTC